MSIETMTEPPASEKMIREGGGVYIYRTRKPASLLGFMQMPFRWCLAALPVCAGLLHFTGGPSWIALLLLFCTGRHFAYVGETVSFKDRHGEHIKGGGRWQKRSAAWSDLDPVCVLRIPLPRQKWLLRAVETFLIVVCAPVYNEKKNMWNLRRIPRDSALRMRKRRDKRRFRLNYFNIRTAHLAVIVFVLAYSYSQGVI